MKHSGHPATPSAASTASVLLVDDTPANLVALRAILEDLGQNLVDVRSGEEAIAQLMTVEFAVVLIDVRMPGFSGFDTAKLIRADELSRHTPIIFLTADDIDREQIEAGYALGAVDFFVKPLSPVVVRAKVRGFVTLFQEKQRAKHEADQLRLLIQGTTDYAIFMLDPQGRVVTWNSGAERFKGYKAEEIIGQHFTKFYPQEALDQGWPTHELKVATAEGRFEDEGWRVRKDGTQFWANVVITALHDEHGKLLGFSKITRDMTERKRAEENARRLAEEAAARQVAHEERERLQVTLASIGDAVISTDANGRVDFLNRVAEELVGWKSSEAFGRTLEDVFRIVNEDTREPVENPALRALKEGKIVGLANHTVLVARDGTERPIDDSAAPIRDSAGSLIGVVLIFRDVTEQRQAERELREQTANAEVLLRVGSLLAQEHDLHRLVQVVTDESTRLCAAQFGAFFYNVVGDRGEAYTLYTLSGVPREAFARFPMPRNTALFGPTFRGEGVVRLDDVTQDSRYGKSGPYHGMPEGHLPVRSYLAVPVISRTGEVLGGLFFGHAEAGVFTPQHERLLVGIAGQAAVAIDDARLHQRTQASAERLNLALSAADLGDWNWDAASGVVTFSERAAEVFGIPPGPRMTWTEMQGLVHEDDRERVSQEVQRVIVERVQYDIEYRVNRQDGSQVWVGMLGRAVYDASGQVSGMYGVVQDVTDRKRLEQSLRESEEKLRLLADTIPQLAWMARLDGHIFWYNRRWYEYTGTTPEEMEGWGWQTVHDPEVLPQVVERWKHSLETGEPFNMVFPLRGADGVLRPFLTRVNPLRDEAGRILYWFGTSTDISEQKRAEEELRYRHELLRAITDTATTAIFMMDERSRCTFMNPAAEQMTGYSFREAEGQILHDLIHHTRPDGSPYPVSECPIDRALPEGYIVHNHEDLFVRTDCSLFPVLCNARPVVREGVVVGTVIEVRDITLQKQAEAALRESEEWLRLALDAGRMGVWDWNVRTGDLKWSDSLEPLHGLAPGTFGGTFEHFQQLIHPEDRDTVNAAIRQALELGGEFYVEFRNLWQNGGIHWIAGSGKVLYGENGQPLRMVGIGLDVTQRKRAEQTARFLADASAALAVLVDFDSTLQKVASLAVPHFADWMTVDVLEDNGNLRRVAVAHVDPAKVQLAHDLHRRFPADPSAPNGVWNILRTGQAEIVQVITDDALVASIKDDELLDITRELGLQSYIGVPLTVRGKTLGVLKFIIAESDHAYDETDLAVAKDLASRAAIAMENSQLYRELRDADRRKDEFLATLAHELRNPLAPIRNGLQVLRLAGDEMADEVRSMMERQLNQMVRLVDDLLDVSRITRNKLELRKERVSLAAVINSAVETNRPLMEQAGHSFSLTLPPEPVYLDADLTRLAQVFSNLLNNATKYTERGGYISLTGELSGAEVLVEVRDTGLGIPAEALPSLFELFSQVDRNMEWAQGGLGIGLSLVRRLVEMHGGTVEAHSDGLGTGSQFVVRLPVVKATPRVGTSQGDDGLSASAKKRILVVDDNQDSALSLGMMLQLLGNEIHTAHDGLAAVEAAEKFRPELTILDIGLPKLNGYDACRRIREQPWSTGMVIAALTGWGQEEDRRRSQEAGFNHHLVKPVEIDSLKKLLAEPPPQSPSPKSTTPNRASLRVLVVDDRRDATYMLKTLLNAAGHDVRTAADGTSALATALDFQPDVVLLDISLPGMSGLEVAKRIRQLPTLKDIVLVALTGYGEEADRQRSFEAGFNHHLVKPTDIRIVREILATVNVK